MSEQTVEWYYNPLKGQPRYLDLKFLAKTAQRIDIATAINKIVAATLSVRWEAEPSVAKDFLQRNHINDILPKFLRDILIYDAGVITKGFTRKSYHKKWFKKEWHLKPEGKRELLEIHAADGSSFLKEVDVNGIIYRYWQYSHMHPQIAPIEFDLAEVAYAMLNPVSYKAYGYSLIESLEPDFKPENTKNAFQLLENGEPSDYIIQRLRRVTEGTINTHILNEFKKRSRFIFCDDHV
jgi:hypothetical protein